MFNTQFTKQIVTTVLCVSLCAQQAVCATQPSFHIVNGVKVYQEIKDITAGEHNCLQGAIVDSSGAPIAGADVVIGQQGNPLAILKTDDQGQYAKSDLAPGVYQVATYAGVQTVRIWAAQNAPQGAAAGLIQVADAETIRGNGCSDCDSQGCDGCGGGGGGGSAALCNLLKSPLVWGVAIAAAIVLPLALDDDDAS